MRALLLSLAILLAHVSPLSASSAPGGCGCPNSLRGMMRSLRFAWTIPNTAIDHGGGVNEDGADPPVAEWIAEQPELGWEVPEDELQRIELETFLRTNSHAVEGSYIEVFTPVQAIPCKYFLQTQSCSIRVGKMHHAGMSGKWQLHLLPFSGAIPTVQR